MITVTEHIARKRHGCIACGLWIWPGEMYRSFVAVCEGDAFDVSFYHRKAHSACVEHDQFWELRSRVDDDRKRREVAARRLASINRIRGTDFRVNERVTVEGKPGRVVGGNDSANLDILFDGERHPSNCHPFWELVRIEHNERTPHGPQDPR